MIPKTIHYCWFGRGEMSPLMKKCLRSWEKYCPDYQIIEWNEDNFDVNAVLWTKQAYETKKYAFVADYVRLRVLYEHGGVYMDTDQELIQPLKPFHEHSVFLGFMDDVNISMGIVGAEPGSAVIRDFLDYYDNRAFLVDGKTDVKPNTNFLTDILVGKGLVVNDQYQVVCGVHVYPRTYFCPTSCISVENVRSKDTVALHHWAMTWRTEKGRRDINRAKFHSTRFYKIMVFCRYLPNRVVRGVFGDKLIDKMKERLGK